MSFGVRDSDWVEPEEDREPPTKCGDCWNWARCPCGSCGWGWCSEIEDFMHESESCGD